MKVIHQSMLVTFSLAWFVTGANASQVEDTPYGGAKVATQWYLKSEQDRATASTFAARFAQNGAKHLSALAIGQSKENIMVSPYSLQECFGMLRLGTSGKSAEQINSFLGNPGSPKEVGNFSKVLKETQAPLKESDILRNANGLFVAMDAGVKPAFMQAASDLFGGGVAKTTFPNPGLKQVNGFVNDETRGKIPKIFDSLPADTALVLVNAVSFLDTWQTPFKTSATKLKDFQTGQGSQVKTLMMQNDDVRVQHASTSSVQVISLYFNSRFKMIFILGKPGTNPVDNFANWSDIIKGLDESSYGRPANVSIPKWTSEFTWDIGESMKSQKLTAPFAPSNDFSAIADKQVFVGQAIQKTYIKVDEKGAEASAATGIAIPTGSPMQPEKKIVFNANRPFAYAIVDMNNIPFFMGVVNDPR